MVDWWIKTRLMGAFAGSFVSRNGEFVVSKTLNQRIYVDGCSLREIQCKVLERFSRDACASRPYRTESANVKVHERMRSGINRFLGTDFSPADMCMIYECLGGREARGLTLRFIDSGFNMKVLVEAADALPGL